MDVFVRGSNKKVKLSDKDQVGSPGGQGTVYRLGDVAYKIYHDPANMIPLAKIEELSVIQNPKVIRPQDVLVDKGGKPVGYTMRFLQNTYVLCELFNRDGCDRAGLDDDGKLHLVQEMQGIIVSVHDSGNVIGDGNEMNYLVAHDLSEVYCIDTDNFQTPHFPCVAIMPNIRDRHGTMFCKEADWFAAGILWFNLWVGIHPFMVPHPDPRYKLPITPERFENRMQDCISGFDPKCKLPSACNPITVIPQAYRDWMKAMFVDKKRCAPPTGAIPVVVIYQPKVTRIMGADKFDIQMIMEVAEPIVSFFAMHGQRAALTKKAIHVGTTKTVAVKGQTVLGISPKLSKLVAGGIRKGQVVLHNVSDDVALPVTFSGEQIMAYNGTIYVKHGESLLEVQMAEFGSRLVSATTRTVGTCMDNSTRFYDGVVVQTLKDRHFINVFPEAGVNRQVTITELQGRGQIVAAKFENNVLMVVLSNKGQYDRFVFRFSRDFTQYDVREVKNVQFTGLNFTVLDNGVCCCMTEEEEIELFRNVRNDPDIKVIKDSKLHSDIRLFHDGTTVVFAKDDAVYSMKLKP